MPPRLSAGRLIAELGTGVSSVSDLKGALGVSQPSLSRVLTELIRSGQVIHLGVTRGARYALRRTIPGIGASWPLYRVGRLGEIVEIGTMNALAADQYFFETVAGAMESEFQHRGVTSGLPYFLQDQRPGGFLGRAVPARYPDLHLPPRVIDWSDDHYLRYLTRHGSDAVGDLILGEAALDEHLSARRRRVTVGHAARAEYYPQLALEVMQGGLPGSSAHGEHPKFLVAIDGISGSQQVLVKFSPELDTALGRRWSDLLIAEYHAHEILRDAQLPACTSRVHQFANRTYLEVDRFDREGSDGRIGVVSLMAIEVSRHGEIDNWVAAARRLHGDHVIDAVTLEQVRLVATFGELIANTDRHFGNLAFNDDYRGNLTLAPVYDMLPMLFAPQNDQILARAFEPPDPTANSHRAWGRARAMAQHYWQALIDDDQLSGDFKGIAAGCLATLRALPQTGAYASESQT